MEIIVSKEDHIEPICNLLLKHFTDQNQYLWIQYYQSNFDIIQKHIHKRITHNDKNYKYFSMIDDKADFVWFVNIMTDWERWEILVVLDTAKNRWVCTALLNYWTQYLKDNWVTQIYAESFAWDEFYANNLKSVNWKLLSQKWII